MPNIRIRLVENPVTIGYLGEEVNFAKVEVDCAKLYDATERGLNSLKKEAVERYIKRCEEIYMPVLEMYGTVGDLGIRFIDGRHTFYTLYKKMGLKRLTVMVPENQVGLIKRLVG